MQMAVMFMKIDTNCDGTVDWVRQQYFSLHHRHMYQKQDEFCTFMLLEYQEKDLMEGEKLPLFPYPLKVGILSNKTLMHKSCTVSQNNKLWCSLLCALNSKPTALSQGFAQLTS